MRMALVTTRYWWLVSLYMLSSFILAFPMVSISVALTRDLNASMLEVSFYHTIVFIPWNFRAIYGLISDTVPINGQRRRFYLVVCYLLVGVCQVMFGQLVDSLATAYVIGIFLSFFTAFSAAVLDGVSVDLALASFDEGDSASHSITKSTDIQSANMAFRSGGTMLAVLIAGLLSAGLLSAGLSTRWIITISCIFPIISAIICILVPLEQHYMRIPMARQNVSSFFRSVCSRMTEHRWKTILIPGLFVFVYASIPTSNVPFNFFVYQSLGFSDTQLHAFTQCASIGSLVGTIAYWVFFRKTDDIRKAFGVSLVINALSACTRLLVLLSGWKSIYFVCGDEMLIMASSRLTLMAVLVYASVKASTPYEGFLFGVFISLVSWGGTLSGIIRSALAARMSLDSLVALTAFMGILPLFGLNALKCADRPEKCIGDESTDIISLS